jgi:hypothetical protein
MVWNDSTPYRKPTYVISFTKHEIFSIVVITEKGMDVDGSNTYCLKDDSPVLSNGVKEGNKGRERTTSANKIEFPVFPVFLMN